MHIGVVRSLYHTSVRYHLERARTYPIKQIPRLAKDLFFITPDVMHTMARTDCTKGSCISVYATRNASASNRLNTRAKYLQVTERNTHIYIYNILVGTFQWPQRSPPCEIITKHTRIICRRASVPNPALMLSGFVSLSNSTIPVEQDRTRASYFSFN